MTEEQFPDVSPEFIEETKKANLVKPRQKFAPYTKAERTKRRKEVYRLHFEIGMSASEIADAMKVNRNTINEDLRLLYKQVGLEAPEYSQYYNKQMARIESQRSRVLRYLLEASTLDEKLAVERLVADIDFKMLGAATKVEFSAVAFWERVKQTYNLVAEKKGLDYRIASFFELMKISNLARKDLDEMYYKFGRSLDKEKSNRK